MATIRRRKNNWQAVIRLKGHPAFYKTFTQKTDAKNWTKIAEHRIHRDDAGILIKKYPIFKEKINFFLNGNIQQSVDNNINITFPDIDGEYLFSKLDDISTK